MVDVVDLRRPRVLASACPKCGKVHDAAAGFNNTVRPKAGDLALCNRCGACNTYGADGVQLAPFDETELDQGTREMLARAREAMPLVMPDRQRRPAT